MQLAVVMVLVALAACYVVRGFLRPWLGGGGGCASGCGSCAAGVTQPAVVKPGRIPLM